MAAGAVAKKVLRLFSGTEVVGFVQKVQDVEFIATDYDLIDEEKVALVML